MRADERDGVLESLDEPLRAALHQPHRMRREDRRKGQQAEKRRSPGVFTLQQPVGSAASSYQLMSDDEDDGGGAELWSFSALRVFGPVETGPALPASAASSLHSFLSAGVGVALRGGGRGLCCLLAMALCQDAALALKSRVGPLEDDIVLPPFAARFKEGVRLGGCLLIHHTSRRPGFDTVRCLPARRRACHASVPAALFPSVFSLSLSVSQASAPTHLSQRC